MLGRLSPNGTPDSSFGTSGLMVADLAPGQDHPADVAVGSDGKIWISGDSSNPGVPVHFLLARFLSAGSVDTFFSQDGNASAPLGLGRRMALDSSQRVVMVGWGSGGALLVARYLRDGAPVPPTPPGPPPDDGGPGGRSGGSGGVAGGVATNAQNVHVHRVFVPRSRNKLASKGVRVLASCDQDCEIGVEVRVSRSAAGAMGLRGTLIAQGVAFADAGQRRWVRAKTFRSVRTALRSFTGLARLRVNVTGVAR
jgi:hypothetical protein